MNAAPAPLVRPLRADERATWQPLWRDYLAFYKAALPDAVYDLTWQRLHDPAEPMFVLGAFAEGHLRGIVHGIFHRSCWTAGDYCYLQDLFVHPEARGRGLGAALIEAVAAEARAKGANRVHWLTGEDNAQARVLYDRLSERSGFIQYRIML
jgi:GNAT superfamily N-acetyltransferase